MKRLKQIATLQTGIHLKSSDFCDTGDAFFISLRDFNNLTFSKNAPLTKANFVKEKYIVSENDVLFSTRVKFNAYQLPKTNKKYIASNSFVIIKPNKNVLPAYLSWFLNHPKTRQKIKRLTEGHTKIPFLTTKMLGDLEITLPCLSKQKQIIQINNLCQKELNLTKKIIEKKELLTQELLFKTIKK